MQQDGSLRLETSAGEAPGNGTVRSGPVLKLDTWVHVVVSARGDSKGSTIIYVDGKPVATGEIGGKDLNNPDVDLMIGNVENVSYGFFHGLIDEARIYTVALTERDVKKLYESN